MSHSPLARIVRFVNILIVSFVVVALAAVYGLVWDPLPQRSGSIETPVAARAVVQFDARGVPHIAAGSLDDALFVQGYVTAQDRLFQMDALRRAAAGELAEIVGPAALEADRPVSPAEQDAMEQALRSTNRFPFALAPSPHVGQNTRQLRSQ